MNVTLRQLRAFVAVANLGSFTAAANRLHLTQSALSVLVKELEREVEATLFHRTTRSVELSEVGRDFYPHAEQTIQSYNSALVRASAFRKSKRAVVTVSAPQLTACSILIPAVSRFTAKHPDVDVKLSDDPAVEIPLRVLSGEADLGICPDRVPDRELDRTLLVKDQLHVVCQQDSPLARKKRVTWAELERQKAIVTARDFAARVRIDLGAEAEKLRPTHEVSNLLTAFAIARATGAVTVGPAHCSALVRAFGLTMRPLVEPEVLREFAILSRRARPLTDPARMLVEFLVDCARKGWGDSWQKTAPRAESGRSGRR